MTLAVRSALPAEMPALLDLWVEAWAAFLPDIDFEARRPWFTTYLADLQRDGARLLVATDGWSAVGFVTVNPINQDMDQLVTARAAQRSGVGRRLVGAAKDLSPTGLGLTVLQCNTAAIGLYGTEGFTVVGESVSLRSGLPTFLMRWRP